MILKFFAIITFVGIFETNGQLLWNEATINDLLCTYPKAIAYPQHIVTALLGFPQGFKLYAPLANKTYYRWMYQKAKNSPAINQADIDSLKPRITFPGVTVFPALSQGRVDIFEPPTAYYKLLCIPNNLAFSNATCSVVEASAGSAPEGFGFKNPTISTFIWADSTAFAEWHCFEGNRQVFNVISLKSTLTEQQIKSFSEVVVPLGFSPNNFEYQVYN